MLKIGLLLYPNINPFHFSIPYMVFKDAIEQNLFDMKIVTATGKPFANQIVQPPIDGNLSILDECDIIIIPGWENVETQPDQATCIALQTAYHRGSYLVGLCYGTYALAYSGLLNGKRAATHWHGEQDFSHRFPMVKLDVNALYVEDSNIITSAGTAAALDCCLYIIRKFYGVKIANKTARLLVVPPQREGGQAQFIDQPLLQSTKNKQINNLLIYLHENLALNHNIDSISQRCQMSRSTFTRHFRKATGMTFWAWLNKERLQRSLELLECSSFSIEQIAEKVGFQNTVSFRQQFFKYYKVCPSQWRKTFSIKNTVVV